MATAKEEDDARPAEESNKILRKLIPTELTNELAKRSDAEGLKQTAFHAGCLIITSSVLYFALYGEFLLPAQYTWPRRLFIICALMLHAFVLSFSFHPLHEAVHETVFQTRFLNTILKYVTGAASMRPPYHYKVYHYAHHRHTGNPEKDPELSDTLLDPNVKTVGAYLLYLSSVFFWVDRFGTLFRHARGIFVPIEFYISSERIKASVMTEARMFLGFYACVTVASLWRGSSAAFWFWFLPTLVGQPFLRWYLLAEHTGCPANANMLANTRTTKTFGLYGRLAWNMNWHSEHHAWPYVPFYALPRLHDEVDAALRLDSTRASECKPTGYNGYAGVHQWVVSNILNGKER